MMEVESPGPFADACAELGITLPEPVTHAVDRYRAVDRHLWQLANEQTELVDISTVDPADVENVLDNVLDVVNRKQHARHPAVLRLQRNANAAAITAIRNNGDAIIAALRPIHDRAATGLTEAHSLLRGVEPIHLAAADEATRKAWIDRPDLVGTLRKVRGIRETMLACGYQAQTPNTSLGRELEAVTRYVKAPEYVTRQQLVAWYEAARQFDWDSAIGDGAVLWLPTLAEQAEEVDRLTAVWQRQQVGS